MKKDKEKQEAIVYHNYKKNEQDNYYSREVSINKIIMAYILYKYRHTHINNSLFLSKLQFLDYNFEV